MQKEIKNKKHNDKWIKLSEKAKENLRRMAEWRREESKYLTLQPGEEFCKLFDREKRGGGKRRN
jgi:hypothetical protein